ncbi:EAL domain-containing protein [Mariprofundus sp. KV]|nr:EAL domain-containing protein [Mariprofundus sp. KV]
MTSLEEGDLARVNVFKVVCENLQEIEMAFGATVGLDAIKLFGERIRRNMPQGAHLARARRSEFTIVTDNLSNKEKHAFLRSLTSSLKNSIRTNGINLHLEYRIGYTSLHEKIEDPDVFLQRARIASLYARKDHVKFREYNVLIDENTKESLSLLGELRKAIEQERLELYYQPKVLMSDHSVVGAEALARWNHSTRGIIPPGLFIPQAEQCDLIGEITKWALQNAAKQQTQWKEHEAHNQLKVAVNISVFDLVNESFPGFVKKIIDQHELDPSKLELELTESQLMENVDAAKKILNELSDASIILSIDDFGTGYSSLKYLDLLPIDYIKIDQAFVFRLIKDAGSRNIVQAAINLSHSLGIKVVAEGIEDIVTYRMLADMGCDIGQGYFISRPVPVKEFDQFSFNINAPKKA